MIVIMVIGLIVLVGYFAVSRIAAEVTDLIQNFPDIYAQLEEGMLRDRKYLIRCV